jgi:predicted cation transporter
MPTSLQVLSTLFFLIAILHTFLVSKFERIARKFPKNSIAHNFFHLFSEVEAVFGIWAFLFLFCFFLDSGRLPVVAYVESLNFTEPLFVFVIMCMAATRPLIVMAERMIGLVAKILPFSDRMNFYVATMIIGPILGSFITEAAAMTVTALILLNTIFSESISLKLKYATLALLFVNISVGGTLTHFAAPPVLMIARKWNWDTFYMMTHFGYKAAIAIILSTSLITYLFRKELNGLIRKKELPDHYLIPRGWKMVIHSVLLFLVVYTSHHPAIFFGFFILFLAFVEVTEKYQDQLKLKQSLLVGVFLAGLVILGTMQSWWLRPLLLKMNDVVLFFGATTLTAITDNAALTYLGSLANLSELSKYSLVAGAVAGGGLTVIANAPNPVGFGILRESFGHEGINPLRLFIWALIPTAISILALLFLPTL